MKSAIRWCTFYLLGLICVGDAAGGDWPQFLGPTRNGVAAQDEHAAATFPAEGPRRIWQADVGEGFSGPVIMGSKLIIFHRLENRETVDCLEAESGKRFWRTQYETGYQDDFGFEAGPRATPTIESNRVYAYGAEGVLSCLELGDGKMLWSTNIARQFGARKGFFGAGTSPLVVRGKIVVNVGGRPGAGVVCFEARTGEVLWKGTDDEASYSSPIEVSLAEQQGILVLTRSHARFFNLQNGKVFWSLPFSPATQTSVTAASPVVQGNSVFLSACYGAGARLIRIEQPQPSKVWESDDALSCHYATPILSDGFLYGVHGRTDPGFSPAPIIRCVEFATGKTKWENADLGAATLTLVGRQILVLTERGELVVVANDPSKYKPIGRYQILPSGVRAHPAVAAGRLFARSKRVLAAFDMH